MSGLAHFLEAEGISTSVIGLIPQHVRVMRPPRALLVPFPLGRPLGAPRQSDQHLSVLRAALALCKRNDVPVVQIHTDSNLVAEIEEEGWACPVTFASPQAENTESAAILGEVEALMPWFERGRRERSFSATGASGLEIRAIAQWLVQFLADPTPQESPTAEQSLALTFKLAAEDLKTFCLEAASAMPGQPSAQALAHWFWRETRSGALLKRLRAKLANDADAQLRIYARFTLVPESAVEA